MSVYIYKNNQQTGPYEENVVSGWLREGQLSGEDLAWRQGAQGWQPLRNFFPVQPTPAAPGGFAAPVAQAGINNHAVQQWARQALANRVEVKMKFNSLFAKIITYGALFFIPGLVFLFGVFRLFTEGIRSGALATFVFAAIVAAPFALILLLVRFTRKNLTKYLDADGVQTLYGKRHRWEDLRYVDYKQVRRAQGGLIGILVHAILFSGSERVMAELVFGTGKAVIPPLAYNQKEILGLIETIPAQRLYEGKVRQ